MIVKVIHVLADGTTTDSIEGYIVKPDKVPELYSILKQLNNKNGGFNND